MKKVFYLSNQVTNLILLVYINDYKAYFRPELGSETLIYFRRIFKSILKECLKILEIISRHQWKPISMYCISFEKLKNERINLFIYLIIYLYYKGSTNMEIYILSI